jgi:segregation and condensation protein A
MPLEPVPMASPDAAAIAVSGLGGDPFEVRLPVFSGPLALLLHLIESRQLEILTVPLAELADAYVAHLASNPVDARQLSEFVAIAAQLILLKSRRLLPGAAEAPSADAGEEPDEEELRRRLLEYRALRDASRVLGEQDLVTPLFRREPRDSDLPIVVSAPLPVERLVEALERLAQIPEPAAEPPEIVAREITIGMQITALRAALARGGRIVLQELLAACGSRTEATVTVLAALELVRRRQVRVSQRRLFGPIVIEALP